MSRTSKSNGTGQASPVGAESYRWVVCALLFFATTINYIDRQILSLLKEVLYDRV